MGDDVQTIKTANEVRYSKESVKEISFNDDVCMFMKKLVPRLTMKGATVLISKLLYGNIDGITGSHLTSNPKTLIRKNLAKFDNNIMKPEEANLLRLQLIDHLKNLGKDLEVVEPVDQDDMREVYKLNKSVTYDQVRRVLCESGGQIEFQYDFDNPDMKFDKPIPKPTLQLSSVHVVTLGQKFDYPIQYHYKCPVCGNSEKKFEYLMISTKKKHKCVHRKEIIKPDGSIGVRQCNEILYPDMAMSKVKVAYYYNLNYEDESGQKFTADAIGFKKYETGYYDCVLFKLNTDYKQDLVLVLDVKMFASTKMNFPEKNDDENYLLTLQRSCDKFIQKQTGMRIFGLLPIKVALLIQFFVQEFGMKLQANIQLVGDGSTGKSTIFKYYGFMLGGSLNLSTNGLSVSIPALRGTPRKIRLLGSEHSIITSGYLGEYKIIHIDEAGENLELIQNLKTFLLEANYSYDKAGATGVFHTRKAQINLSENLRHEHVGLYQGGIKKAYKALNEKIGDSAQVEWNSDWDLYKPIYTYDNPYLRKVIDDYRIELQNKQMFWIDGHDYALHERFPFYFYLVNSRENKDLSYQSFLNVINGTVDNTLELVRMLKTDDLVNFAKLIIQFKDSQDDNLIYEKVREILKSYGIKANARVESFYFIIVKISRIVNQRMQTIEQDYDMLRWFIETTQSKLDIQDTYEFKIKGAVDIKTEMIKHETIKESIETLEGFGSLKDDFGG